MSVVPKGDTVLVTGATGFIGSRIAEELIAAGYKVRGTSRSSTKAQRVTDYLEKKFGPGKFEIAEVPDMVAENAYDEAVKGVSGICHVASILTFSSNPDEVIPPTVQGALNILKSATLEPKVKSFVYTSSSTAALTPVPDQKIVITKDSWNDAATEAAYQPSPDSFIVYAASKNEAEKAIWKAAKEANVPFQVATVLPNANFGARLSPPGGNSTGDWPPALYEGQDWMFKFPPQWFVDVNDTAKLHVIALIDPACNGERLFAFSAPYNWNDLLAVFRKLEPEKEFLPDIESGHDISVVPNEDAEALLKKHYGKGWTSLEESLKRNIGPVLV